MMLKMNNQQTLYQKVLIAKMWKEDQEEREAVDEEARAALEDEMKKRSRISSPSEGDSTIIVGPVVGKVTDTSARILVETKANCTLICTLKRNVRHGEVITNRNELELKCSKDFRAELPGVFKFQGLVPGASYDVSFSGDTNKTRVGKVRTIHSELQDLGVAVACCDKGFAYRGPSSLYTKLYEDFIVKGKVDIVVHNGDQVYADVAWKQAEAILQDKSIPDGAEKQTRILGCYKKIYQATWDAPDKRRVLGTCSNLMLWDDHEVRNDWGTMKEDSDPTSQAFYIGKLARMAYWQYQRQLWDDMPLEMLLPDQELKENPNLVLSPLQLIEMTVYISAAKNLPPMDSNGLADPYLIIYGLDKFGKVLITEKTKHMTKTLNPQFNYQGFEFTKAINKDMVLSRLAALRVEVWDHDTIIKDDFVGEVFLNLGTDVEINTTWSDWRKLHSSTTPAMRDLPIKGNGELHFEIRTKTNADATGPSSPTRHRIMGTDIKIDRLNENPPEMSMHKWGRFGLILLDNRGCRSFGAKAGDQRPFLGSYQWGELEHAFSPMGFMSDVKACMIVHSMPPVMMSTGVSSTLAKLPPQVDKMGFGLFPQEQVEYVALLDKWKRCDISRELLLVGGDLHFGVQSEILDGKRVMFRQIITSPISNNPPPRPVYWLLRRLMRGTGRIGNVPEGGRYAFNHTEFVEERNFALVDLNAQNDYPSSIYAQLVSAQTSVNN
jgi:hypothetical protein